MLSNHMIIGPDHINWGMPEIMPLKVKKKRQEHLWWPKTTSPSTTASLEGTERNHNRLSQGKMGSGWPAELELLPRRFTFNADGSPLALCTARSFHGQGEVSDRKRPTGVRTIPSKPWHPWPVASLWQHKCPHNLCHSGLPGRVILSACMVRVVDLKNWTKHKICTCP